MADTPEKRRFTRWDSVHLISYTHFDDGKNPVEMGMCKTLDLSEGGVTIQTHRSFPVDTGLEMVVAVEEHLIKPKGKVVHVRETGKDRYEVGVCFTEMDDADRSTIHDFLHRISAT
jgi:c-di-GMP-binding flagellar brake protein YcgR